MHHRRATRLLWCIFSFTEIFQRVHSIGPNFPEEMSQGKSPVITTPFSFKFLCVFFTSIQIKLLFDQNLNLMVIKITVSPVQLIPPLIRNAVLQNSIEYGMQEIYLRVRLAMNSLSFLQDDYFVVRQSPWTLTGKIIHVVREVSQ